MVKVFISWSREYSRRIAEILANHIGFIVPSAECFFSDRDIEAGAPWLREIWTRLGNHSVGVICVTKGVSPTKVRKVPQKSS